MKIYKYVLIGSMVGVLFTAPSNALDEVKKPVEVPVTESAGGVMGVIKDHPVLVGAAAATVAAVGGGVAYYLSTRKGEENAPATVMSSAVTTSAVATSMPPVAEKPAVISPIEPTAMVAEPINVVKSAIVQEAAKVGPTAAATPPTADVLASEPAVHGESVQAPKQMETPKASEPIEKPKRESVNPMAAIVPSTAEQPISKSAAVIEETPKLESVNPMAAVVQPTTGQPAIAPLTESRRPLVP
ncbi:MAG: hypothetical protein NTX86_05490 [Candidatus Dependentiae bacterium]|nr:hypothetical protein [Candidatus Dependentiae bacterium]